MNFLAELRRRNVIRMAGLYLVAAWLITQVAGTLLPMFDAPSWIVRAVVIALAIGFLPALVFAWVFELTPEGLKRDADVPAAESIAPQTARRMEHAIVVLLALALAYFAFDKFVLAPQREQSIATQAKRAGEAIARKDAERVPDKSIAVLPLENEGQDHDHRYFSDGLSQNLTTALSQFEGLKVISCNSSFKFRGSNEGSAAIGRKLGVAHLVEGNVQRIGGDVRILISVVNASDGSILWSQRYDRPYRDLFKLQDELSQAVAEALHAKVLGGKSVQSDRPPGGSLDAYDAYLHAEYAGLQGDEAGYRRAIDSLGAAIRIDPGYAEAYASRAMSWINLARKFLSGEAARNAYAKARKDVDAALMLDPDRANAHVARGVILASADFNWAAALEQYQRAVQLAPNNSGIKDSLADMMATLGRTAEAVAYMRDEVDSDPLCAHCRSQLALYLAAFGHLEEAQQVMRKAIEMEPGHADRHTFLAMIEILRGDAPAALAAAQQEIAEGGWRDIALALALQIGSDRNAADAALAHLVATQSKEAAFQIAQVYALRRDADNTFAWLDRAWDNRDPGIDALLYDSFLLRFRDDPRFAAFARKAGLPTTTDAKAMP